jgi:ABC-2 type transport system ATP-binding protein
MKQRLGIAQALIHRPRLLVCDEPTSALDPAGRKDVIDVLKAIKHQTTVLFSTHILSDVERICDEIGLLHGGSMRLEGKLEEIRQMHAGSGYAIEFQDEADAARFLNAHPGGEHTSSTRLLFASGTQEEMSRAMGALASMGICPVKIELCEPSLESLFLEAAGL